jgi:predicted CoA-binding protein
MKNKTVIVGATPNEGRYAFLAARMLKEFNHDFVPLGIREGSVEGRPILDIRTQPKIEGVDTITLYLSPRHQPAYYDYLIGLKPRRIIFNPGTENPEFMTLAEQHGVIAEQACTLVLLRSHQY